MSETSPVSLPKRLITVESRVRTGSDPVVYSLKKSNLEKVPSADNLIGQPCSNCTDKCHGYMPHLWRKRCITCGCSREQHLLDSDPRNRLVYLEDVGKDNGRSLSASEQRLGEKYAWYPSGVSPDIVEQYMRCLPADKIPLRGSKGEKYRVQQFNQQLPEYDSNSDACHKMDDLDKKRMGKFVDRTKRRFFGVGSVDRVTPHETVTCANCSNDIPTGAVCVRAERTGDELAWHPQCFQCETCQELLVDLIYFHSPEKNVLLCGRHHGESMVPRCSGCEELIFSSTLTESKGKKYHKQHLCCFRCDTLLHESVFKEVSGNLYCKTCYDRECAAICESCTEPISIQDELCRFKDRSWHKECFICRRCQKDLSCEKHYLVKGDLLCKDCLDPVAQCHACKDAIIPNVSYLKHESRAWHSDCFKCTLCKVWLVDGDFRELDDNLMCTPCYIDKVGKKCTVCSKSIVGKGVKFGFSMYHPECFNCEICGVNLVDYKGKVKERNGKTLCQECTGDVIKKCFRCRQPITSKHTIYREKLFHLDCFTCNLCGSSVASTEFFETNLGEILCQRCTKIR